MALTLRQTGILKWNDLNGATRTNTFTTQANPVATLGAFGTLATAMQNASSCGLMYAAMQPVLNVGAAGGSGPYPTAYDYLQFIFRSSEGTTARLNLPGPVATLFLPGNERADFEDPLVIAIVEAAYGALADPYGNPFTQVVSGKRFKLAIPAANGG